jgi:transcriptional regulator with XRE-family HTH domain
MKTEQKIDLGTLVTRLEYVMQGNIQQPEQDEELVGLIRAIIEKGIAKPNDIHLYELAIKLLSSVNAKTADLPLQSELQEVINRLELAKNLIKYKEKAQFSSRELAQKAGISSTYLSRIESCQLPIPTGGRLIKNLARELVVEPKKLFPNYCGNKVDLHPKSYRNPIIRAILEELDGLDDSILKFLLEFIQKFKEIVRK